MQEREKNEKEKEWRERDKWQKESTLAGGGRGGKKRRVEGDEWQGVEGGFDWHQQPCLQVIEATAVSTHALQSGGGPVGNLLPEGGGDLSHRP